MKGQLGDSLDHARRDAGLSHGELWLRYFELGGMSTALQVEAFLYGALRPTANDHDVVAHALNKRFVELGGNHPVPYAEDTDDADEHDRTRRPSRCDSGGRAPSPGTTSVSDIKGTTTGCVGRSQRVADPLAQGARLAFVQGEAPEPSDRDESPLGAEEQAGDDSRAVTGRTAVLSSDVARVGSIPASREVIDGALRLVTALVSETVEGAHGVSVSLERHGGLTTVAASNDTVRRMDDHQYGTGEGPCLAAAAEGHWFHIESLAEESRWPTFVPRAIEEGIASILSTPLMSTDRPLGALNIYSNTERAFGTRQQELVAMFATQASGILVDAGADVTDEQLAKRIIDALTARETIAHAQGVLMARENITAHEAAAKLHRAARTSAVPVLEHAADVVASTRKNPDPIL